MLQLVVFPYAILSHNSKELKIHELINFTNYVSTISECVVDISTVDKLSLTPTSVNKESLRVKSKVAYCALNCVCDNYRAYWHESLRKKLT